MCKILAESQGSLVESGKNQGKIDQKIIKYKLQSKYGEAVAS